MGLGTAWGGHLFCTEDNSRDRYPGAPPILKIKELINEG